MSQLTSLFGNSPLRGDSQRAGNGRLDAPQSDDSSFGKFSQMLRDYGQPNPVQNKAPEAPPTPPAKPPEQPAPVAQEQPAAATAQGPSETQRQEAKLNARRAAAEPAKPTAAKPGEAPAAKTAPAEGAAAEQVATEETDADEKPDALDGTPPPIDFAGPLGLALSTGKALPAEATAELDSERSDGSSVGRRPRGNARPEPLARGPQTDGPAKTDPALSRGESSTAFADDLKQAGQVQAPKNAVAAQADAAHGASIDALLSAQAPASGELRSGGSDAGTPRVMLAHSLYEPGFAPEMAARLSVLTADGVQQAQLHLNPAEMGPVAVQIVVEGQQAQISFHAEQADTRAVLEQALPDLAAALRDSGLTLSGGGVFQQARDQQDRGDRRGGGDTGPTRRVDGSPPVQARVPVATRAGRGVVDL